MRRGDGGGTLGELKRREISCEWGEGMEGVNGRADEEEILLIYGILGCVQCIVNSKFHN